MNLLGKHSIAESFSFGSQSIFILLKMKKERKRRGFK